MSSRYWKSKFTESTGSPKGLEDVARTGDELVIEQSATPPPIRRDPSRDKSKKAGQGRRASPIRRDFSRKESRGTSVAEQPTLTQDNHSRKESKRTGPNGRPMPPQRIPSVQTRYMDMLLAQDTIPRLHNILASLFQWILLAGYLVLPATFNSIRQSKDLKSSSESGNIAAQAALTTVRNLPLLYIGAFCAGIGLLGKAWLWFAHRPNYVWLVNKIFMPGLLNSAAGLISTVVNIYSAQGGKMSVTAKVTLCVTGGLTGVFLILFVLYNFWALKRVKAKHDLELQRDIERGRATGHEHDNEGPIEKIKRKAHEPALEPSSVI